MTHRHRFGTYHYFGFKIYDLPTKECTKGRISCIMYIYVHVRRVCVFVVLNIIYDTPGELFFFWSGFRFAHDGRIADFFGRINWLI